jgi:enoyl-[acyl-carrier protein] reductase II
MLRTVVDIPVIAAGGIGTGSAMYAAMALGAQGVQIGSLFAASKESSAHPEFKRKIVEANDGETHLSLKKLVPVRLLENDFYKKVKEAEDNGASKQELLRLLGKGRAKQGMFEGNISEGELEIGQISYLIDKVKPVKSIIDELVDDFNKTAEKMNGITL